MYRFCETFFSDWLKRKNRKPLVIRGARQVGKSTWVRQFCQQHNLVLCEINLERHLELDKVFATLDLKHIIQELSVILKRSFLHKNHVLFLDEIQATPSALAVLRYFYEDCPDLIVIAAGSLLDFSLKKQHFSMPVGRIEYFHMGPMTFKEFLIALNEDYLIDLINHYITNDKFSSMAHQQLVRRMREYFFVGGMPDAVRSFVETGLLQEASRSHESILVTLRDDFNKYTDSSKKVLQLQNLLSYIPAHLGQKVKYSNISREERARETKYVIELLRLAKICTPIFHSNCSGIPLEAGLNRAIFKLLFADIGLANRILGLDWTAINGRDERTLVNEGGLAEQFIGQHLLFRFQGIYEPQLHYWLREGHVSNAEIDYVITSGDWMIPVEVKSGSSGSLRSLHQFIYAKNPKVAIRFDANLPSIAKFSNIVKTKHDQRAVDYTMMSLPLYFVEETNRLVEQYRQF